MALRQTQMADRFVFSDLEELRAWLNRFTSRKAAIVDPEGADYFVLEWYEETLSDGSIVNNVKLYNADA